MSVETPQVLGFNYSTHRALDPNRTVQILTGHDPTGNFGSLRTSFMADVELRAHGGPAPFNVGGQVKELWSAAASAGGQVPIQHVVGEAFRQQNVESVLVYSCNVDNSHLFAPQGKRIIQGYGSGFGIRMDVPFYQQPGFEKLYHGQGWENAVVFTEGAQSQIYSKSVLHATLEAKGVDPEMIRAHPRLGKSTIAMMQMEGGELRFTASQFSNPQYMMGASVSAEDLPAIIRRAGAAGADEFLTPGGQAFRTLQEAEESLVASIRPSKAAAAVKDLWADAAGYSSEAMETKAVKAATNKLASTADEAVTAVSKNANRQAKGVFKPGNFKGILIGGALIAGGIFLISRHQDQQNRQTSSSVNELAGMLGTPNHPTGQMEGEDQNYQVNRAVTKPPAGSTHVEYSDASLNMSQVEEAFVKHLKTGLAHSSR